MAGIASPTFNKRERIVSRKLIEQLFSKDAWQTIYPYKFWLVYQNGISNMQWTVTGSSARCVRPTATTNRY